MTQHTPEAFPEIKGWQLSRLDGEPTPEESLEIEGMLAACLGLINAGYTFKQATALIHAAPELLQWLGVLLDKIDYTSGACTVTEMVGAVLPKHVIEKARAAIEKAIQ